MANLITTQILTDGPRNATVKITGVLDTSDLALQTVVTPGNFMGQFTGFRIYHLDYSISDQLELQLEWHANTNVDILPLAGRGRMSFVDFGGLVNNGGTGKNGAIDLQSTGYSIGTQIFSLVLELVKEGVTGVGVR